MVFVFIYGMPNFMNLFDCPRVELDHVPVCISKMLQITVVHGNPTAVDEKIIVFMFTGWCMHRLTSWKK